MKGKSQRVSGKRPVELAEALRMCSRDGRVQSKFRGFALLWWVRVYECAGFKIASGDGLAR